MLALVSCVDISFFSIIIGCFLLGVTSFVIKEAGIDIMMNIPGVSFPSAYERKVESTYGEEPIRIIAIDDLIKAKRTVDRDQDRLDVKSLEQAKSIKK